MLEPIVIAIDGPSGAGKGAVTHELALRTGFHILDSGALYRLTGLAVRQDAVSFSDETGIAAVAANLDVAFLPVTGQPEPFKVTLRGEDVTDRIRTDAAGVDASVVAALPLVRSSLEQLQRRFRRAPGLIADGRDMGTVIFPQAPLKVFLTASAQKRAERRYSQLISKGIPAKLDDLLADLQERDARDTNRAHAPLKPAEDAVLLDNTDMGIDESIQLVLSWWQGKQSKT